MSAPPSTSQRLKDIAREISAVRALVDNGYEAFIAEDQRGYLHRRAAERAVEIIHEAAVKLPEELRKAHPEVPWRMLRGMRNRITHAYGEIDYDILWDTLASDLPDVAEALGLGAPSDPYRL